MHNITEEKDGPAVAAYLSAMIGILVMAIVNILTEISEEFKEWVHKIGKAWMPGAEGIGPYSGKETFLLAGWFISWLILHLFLKNKECREPLHLILFLIGVGLATTLLWPPVIHLFIK